MRRTLALAVLGVALSRPMQAQAPAEPGPAPVSRAQFAEFHWIVGQWRGTGTGRLAAVGTFYEEYSVINDSTIRMRTARDSTFTQFTDSASFEWRKGTLTATEPGGRPRVVTRISGDSIQFGSGRGTLYVRVSKDVWRAVFPARSPGEARPYYELERIVHDR